MSKQYICSELFKSMDLRFIQNSITNCCKANKVRLSIEDFKDPNILFNNKELKSRRESMVLDNKLPESGCNGCIKFLPHSFFDNRNHWTNTFLNEEFKEKLLTEDIVNRFTINLSSACDLKCVYCAPKDSSSWAKEVGVPTIRPNNEWFNAAFANFITYLKNKKYDPNTPYFFIISGGEPTYNPHNLELIKQIISIVPNKNLEILLHTNFNTKEKVFNEYIKLFRDNKDVQCGFIVSLDSVEGRSEAIRHGLNWERAMKNLNFVLDNNFSNINVRIANTLSVYSAPYFKDDIEFYLDNFGEEKTKGFFRPGEGFNYAVEPGMHIMGMPEHFKEDQNKAIDFCSKNKLNYLIPHLEQIQNLIGTKINDSTAYDYDLAYSYFKIKRPETDWDGLFPHMQVMIDELYDMYPNKERYVPNTSNLSRPVNSYAIGKKE